MNARKKELCQIETDFINEWAKTKGRPLGLTVNRAKVGHLGGSRPCLADVLHLLREGDVVASDMTGQRGLWTIVGETTDGDLVELEIAVESEECEVELRCVEVLRRYAK